MAIVDLSYPRVRKARLSQTIGSGGYQILITISIAAYAGAIGLIISHHWHLAGLPAALGIATTLIAVWWHLDLSVLPPTGGRLEDRLSVDVLVRLSEADLASPQALWKALSSHWQTVFFLNHLLIPSRALDDYFSADAAALPAAFQAASDIADRNHSQVIELGWLIAGLLLTSPQIAHILTTAKLRSEDIASMADWLGRGLASQRRHKQRYGGIARDWTFGFTPILNQLGTNISLGVMHSGAHFSWLTNSEGVRAIETAFDNHTSAVALLGPDGIGKTSSVYALAQRLIQGQTTGSLAYHQVIGLEASIILSNARSPGDLEHIMLSLAGEAAQAGHIILFLDDAQLFFGGEGPGTFDAGQILLPILQRRSMPLVLAMSSSDFQRLRTHNPAVANLLTPVSLQEPPEAAVMSILEDTAAGLEGRHGILIAYQALQEAYRLSGRYEQEEAYPGKAIKLLQQAVSHAQQGLMNAASVQAAIEQAHGVKVGTASVAEADQLLHLEERIHERMINQSQAVSVVAAALRRARAGVANPRRPIGSFLFLGPTGVGKTELVKAIAATYFGAESAVVRLDMSEYQQPSDVSRLLSNGQQETGSLIMSVRQQPFSVVLLDEIEKAHPNVLNLLLQLLDEGQLTDSAGRAVSFKDTIIIATSNAGATVIREKVQRGESLESFQAEFTDQLINSGQFKPELLNRFDEIVLFRPLNQAELAQVVKLMLKEVNQTLEPQNIRLQLTDAATAKIVEVGYDPRLGARPMRRALQHAVEDVIAQKILRGEARPGDELTLDVQDLQLS